MNIVVVADISSFWAAAGGREPRRPPPTCGCLDSIAKMKTRADTITPRPICETIPLARFGYIKRATPIHRSVVQRSAHARVIFFLNLFLIRFWLVFYFFFLWWHSGFWERGEKKKWGSTPFVLCGNSFPIESAKFESGRMVYGVALLFPRQWRYGGRPYPPTHIQGPGTHNDRHSDELREILIFVQIFFFFLSILRLFILGSFVFIYIYIRLSIYTRVMVFFSSSGWKDGRQCQAIKRFFFLFFFPAQHQIQKNCKRTRNSRHVNIFLFFLLRRWSKKIKGPFRIGKYIRKKNKQFGCWCDVIIFDFAAAK